MKQKVAIAKWLLLLHQLPSKPAYQRVKIWRLLQSVGAVNLKNSAYVLPANAKARMDLLRVLQAVEKGGGDGLVCEADSISGMRDDQMRALFNAARDADYFALAQELRGLLQSFRRTKKPKPDTAPAIAKFQLRLSEIARLDFFGATGKIAADAALAELEHSAIGLAGLPKTRSVLDPAHLTGKTWVTRRDIHVDRIACAWLIARFIDTRATFKFVSVKSYAARPGELRFDMQAGEFTHEGDRCSFETLLYRTGIKDPALRAIGEIIHDIDLKDGKFARSETPGIAHVIAGICRTQAGDEARMARGKELLDDTYEQFRRGA
jgi:hypothetical protein